MSNFENFGLPECMLHTLKHINYTEPTPIQEQTIPVALQGKDVLGSAQTGTGKTAAFAIPLVYHILKNKESTALVLLPTRELADQVLESIKSILGKSSKIKTSLLIGGASMPVQMRQLKLHPQIIVGTPGRINDHLDRRTLHLDQTDFFVLDEMDRMLDMGFGAQLEQIHKFLPEARQTLMFSATLPPKIVALSRKYLKDAVRIAIGSTTAVANNVKQENIRISDTEKYDTLLEQLKLHTGSSLIFVKTKYGTERLAKKLNNAGEESLALHGDLKQNQRARVIDAFRNSKARILVATDIAARGLDIHHIESVINYDLPQCPEDYIHRIGRTARAGESGIAINFLSPKDKEKWSMIRKLLDSAPASEEDEKNAKLPKPKKHKKIAILEKIKQHAETKEPTELKKEFNEEKTPFVHKAKKVAHSKSRWTEKTKKAAKQKRDLKSFGEEKHNPHRKIRTNKPFKFNRFKKV